MAKAKPAAAKPAATKPAAAKPAAAQAAKAGTPSAAKPSAAKPAVKAAATPAAATTAKPAAKSQADTPLLQFLFGFKRRDGSVAISAQFERITDFSDGHAGAYRDGAWGVIDAKGAWVLKPAYARVGPVHSGLVPVSDGKLWGVVDLAGKTVLPITHDRIGAMQQGLIPVCRANRWGVVDVRGKEILPIVHEDVVAIGEQVISVKIDGGFRILSRAGKTVIDGLQFLGQWADGISPAAADGLGGFITETGAWLVKPTYQTVFDFSEGLAAVEQDGLCGYVDRTGKLVIKPAFTAGYDFSGGLARVRGEYAFGYIDTTGKLVIPAELGDVTKIPPEKGIFNEKATRFRNGYARASTGGGFGAAPLVVGFIDSKGRMHDRVPDASKDGPELFESFREENPAWTAWQDTLESAATFQRSFDAYAKNIAAAQSKDEAAAIKAIAAMVKHPWPAEAVWLKIIVYDMNDFGTTVTAMDRAGTELDGPSFEPFKNLAKISEKGGGANPKTANGHRLVNAFLDQTTWSTWRWFAALWRKHAKGFATPAFIQGEDAGELLDLATDQRADEDAVAKRMGKGT